MSTLKETLYKKIEEHRPRTVRLLKEYGDTKISDVTIAQAIGGARGVRCLVTDVSYLDPFEGIRFRGRTIPETFAALPPVEGQEYPSVEGFFYYLMTSEIPTAEQAEKVVADFKTRRQLPDYVKDILRAMPKDTHPMTMYSAGILAMQRESTFVKRYNEGMSKMDYWKPTLEDSLDLLGKLPAIAAGIYRMRFKKGKRIAPKKNLNWAQNYAHMLGIPDKSGDFADCMRLYLVLHCDHEGGNVSAHACHVVGSALSDAYYSVSAGLNGLAGPLHGLANQECLNWV